MQQIINFIIKNSHRLLFLLLLGISFSLVIKSHSYHRSEYVNSANAVTGAYYEKVNEVNEYFSLKEKNKDLAAENALLKELLFNKKDTILTSKTLFRNDLNNYNVVVAKVVKNSFNTRENYITINSGKSSGIEVDMGVVNDRGVVGIIEKTSTNYSTIQSVLNTKSKIHAKIKNSEHFGTLIWDGTNVGFAQLIEVPRLASFRPGDSIVTGANSEIFPENIPIGKIDKIFIDKKTNYYTINIRLFNDMTSLGYVYVIENKKKKEKRQLEFETTAPKK
jgi:rod shape-determining protein MreC